MFKSAILKKMRKRSGTRFSSSPFPDGIKMAAAANSQASGRNARRQISQPVGPQRSENFPGKTYNIWYNKNVGERGHFREKIPATTRCSITEDSGTTKGSSRQWDGTYICLKFSRGCCLLGYECSWIHNLPSDEFESTLDTTKDCFGRERHEHVRDDQSGVGSFSSDEQTAKTLYVGGISVTSDLQSIVYRHFKEWGEIDNVRVLQSKGVAFVRYKNRSNAEFAKEAMQSQALDNKEILNIRWATEDPNPWVKKRKIENSKERLASAILQDYDGPLRLPHHDNVKDNSFPQKRRNIDHDIKESGEAIGYYPDTDYQYYELNTGTDMKYDVHAAQLTGTNQGSRYNTVSKSPPKTLSDLIQWSKQQVSLNRANELSHSKHPGNETIMEKKDELGSISLISAYDSSSDDDIEGNS